MVMMPGEESEYNSIEEVRSTLYPGSAAMLDLEKEEVLEFPMSLTDESNEALKRTAKRATRSGRSNSPRMGEY
jgi:hypothetical protein